jgi:quinol monooxygenase YgiN
MDYTLSNSSKIGALMRIFRIGEFQAVSGKGDALLKFLNSSFVPVIEASVGWLAYQVLQRQDDPDRIMIIETWESVEAHQVSAKGIPPAVLEDVRPLLAQPPAGGYYLSVQENSTLPGGMDER